MERDRASHGTVTRYSNGGCRCPRCRSAWAAYCRDRARSKGRRSREQFQAARRMRLTRRSGESERAFKRRLAGSRVWLRGATLYPEKSKVVVEFRPTELGRRILDSLQAKNGITYDDIVERLLRKCGVSLQFPELAQAG